MRGLTLHRPVAAAHAWLSKDIENRSWPPPAAIVGSRIALHAGRRYSPEYERWIELVTRDELLTDEALQLYEAHRHDEGIVAVATVAGWAGPKEFARPEHHVADAVAASPWWIVGKVGWLLIDTVRLPEPVPCRGAQGLWRLPADVEARVQEQVADGTRWRGQQHALGT